MQDEILAKFRQNRALPLDKVLKVWYTYILNEKLKGKN